VELAHLVHAQLEPDSGSLEAVHEDKCTFGTVGLDHRLDDTRRLMKRKESFATTGPRITVRFFGGFGFGEGDTADLVKAGYGKGVPMGGDLKSSPGGGLPTTWCVTRSRCPRR